MITKNRIKYIRGLSIKKNRFKEGCFIVEGEKMLTELIKSSYNIIDLYATKDWIVQNHFSNVNEVKQADLDRMSNMKSANKVLAIVEIMQHNVMHDFGIKLVLDNIQDPGNLGTIIRTCDWFGINQIICSENTVDVYNPKVVQATMGSLFRVNVTYTNLENYLLKVDDYVYGACVSGENISNVNLHRNCHLLIGNESNGISSDLVRFIDSNIAIKSIGGQAESLNVAVATSILLHELSN